MPSGDASKGERVNALRGDASKGERVNALR